MCPVPVIVSFDSHLVVRHVAGALIMGAEAYVDDRPVELTALLHQGLERTPTL